MSTAFAESIQHGGYKAISLAPLDTPTAVTTAVIDLITLPRLHTFCKIIGSGETCTTYQRLDLCSPLDSNYTPLSFEPFPWTYMYSFFISDRKKGSLHLWLTGCPGATTKSLRLACMQPCWVLQRNLTEVTHTCKYKFTFPQHQLITSSCFPPNNLNQSWSHPINQSTNQR